MSERTAPDETALASAASAQSTTVRTAPRQGEKLRGEDKVARIPVKIAPSDPSQRLRKPAWIRAPFPGTPEVQRLKRILRENRLHTVCEEASCPNLGECFGHGTATFMIMGDICTRRCPFCDVGHGRPNPLDPQEPENLARTVAAMALKYVVVTSVDRDDLRDGGAAHFALGNQVLGHALGGDAPAGLTQHQHHRVRGGLTGRRGVRAQPLPPEPGRAAAQDQPRQPHGARAPRHRSPRRAHGLTGGASSKVSSRVRSLPSPTHGP